MANWNWCTNRVIIYSGFPSFLFFLTQKLFEAFFEVIACVLWVHLSIDRELPGWRDFAQIAKSAVVKLCLFYCNGATIQVDKAARSRCKLRASSDVSWEQVKVWMGKTEVICKTLAPVRVLDPTQQTQSCLSLLTIFMQILFMVFHRLLLSSCWHVQVPCKNLSPTTECCFADFHQLPQWKFRPEDKMQLTQKRFTLLRCICRPISWFHRPYIENSWHNLTKGD